MSVLQIFFIMRKSHYNDGMNMMKSLAIESLSMCISSYLNEYDLPLPTTELQVKHCQTLPAPIIVPMIVPVADAAISVGGTSSAVQVKQKHSD
jgi:hypothetical protein